VNDDRRNLLSIVAAWISENKSNNFNEIWNEFKKEKVRNIYGKCLVIK
jgi:hypothetical protein